MISSLLGRRSRPSAPPDVRRARVVRAWEASGGDGEGSSLDTAVEHYVSVHMFSVNPLGGRVTLAAGRLQLGPVDDGELPTGVPDQIPFLQ